ncbi:cytoplasmic dynein 2 heavy chain 1-like [Acropora palmata]|uniref:cytoplasmic dynein 2 heavy chain 1-like n=1 Tax=Acropora palmata TaxID=6131 RepID=UPI003DA0A4A7
MPSADLRKDFIVATTGNYFGIQNSDSVLNEVRSSKELNTFLDDGNSPVLAAKYDTHQGKRAIHLSSHVEPSDTAEKVLVFFKLQPEAITPDNLHQNVFVSSMLSSPVNTLYHSVQKVFAPLLLKDEKWSRNFDPKLQSLLSELEAGLGSVVRKQDSSSSRAAKVGDEENFGGILTPQDEFQYWSDASVSGYDLSEKERASFFQESFQKGNVAQDFSNLDALDLADILELLESTQDSLDEIWKQEDHKPYSETRMKHLLDVMAGALGRYVQRKLGMLDIWHDSFQQVKDAMHKGISVCERWVSSCETLTSQFWKRFPSHPWRGEKFTPENLSNLAARLEEVLTLRTVHEQLVRLLTTSERQALRTSDVFSPFSGLNPLHPNPYTEPLWRAAVTQYERGMAPAEQKIAGKLRQQLGDLSAKSHQLLREFQRYKELVKRPSINKELAPEREILLGQLTVYVRGIRDDFIARTQNSYSGGKDGSGPPRGRNMPEIVNNIVWVRQLDAKVKETLNTAESLLGDLSGFKGFKREASDLAEELQSYCKDQFEGWVSEMMTALDDPKKPLSLQTSGRLMDLDHKDGKLRVHYGDRLVTLMREVRQLSALGFAVPAKIQQTSSTANKFYRHGMILKQVAHFYNTVDQQMIPSQKPMMLDSALGFERLVKNPKAGSKESGGKTQVTWDNPQELEAYIDKLQTATDKLTSENRRLRKCHHNICDKVVNLMSVDLLRQQPRWKEALVSLREIMTSLVQQGFKAENMKTWKMHWDRQLYKALEHQYQMGLEALNENLPEIKVELVFRHQKLQFRPPLEEIRAKYYREMRKFISIPNHFRGVGEDSSIYPIMIDQNSAGFTTVYKKAEDLFKRLVEVQDQFKDWVVLGTVDLEKLIETHLQTVPDWERNFRALKGKGREAEKLPLNIKVDCISVSTTPVKSTIDDHIQQLFDALLTSLRRSITNEVQTIDTFLTSATEALSSRPQTVEEIGEANAKHAEFATEKIQIHPLFDKAESKNKLLRSVAGGGLEQIGQLQARWDKFELMMQSHELMVKEQVEVMKSNVESRVQVFQQELDKFSARWHQLKPRDIDEYKDSESCLAAVNSINERRAEFAELEETMKRLIFDCQHFGVAEPQFSLAEELKADIGQHEAMWGLYEEFSNGLDELAKEDWISFRGNLYRFDDFLTAWSDKLRSKEPTSMTVRLQYDVDKYKNIVPLLKYVRGEALSPDHWLELFRLLKMPKGTILEKLTFGDVLQSADQIIALADALKELNSRAQGEVSIREALRELELWGAGAVFSLTSYVDSHNKELSIIKDWKDLVNQVGDNQCLLQSLKDSPYYKGFEDKASLWETRLADLDEYLHNLNQIQRKWVYLEPIFGRGALPREQGRFKRVDDDFRAIMQDVSNDNRVLSLVAQSGIRNALVTLLDQLQRCQKSLNEFLEEKRALFPRFYFIGDDDLLEILGQATNPVVIQSHLKKLFAGIHNVSFDEGCKTIVAMKSLDGEVVPLKRPVTITPEVEVWLGDLANEMKDTLKQLLIDCLSASKKGGSAGGVDPSKFPSQILCLAEQIQFTERCEAAIKSNSLQEFQIEMESQLESYTNAEIGGGDSSDAESHVLELKLKALILDTIHAIDMLQQLIKHGIKSLDDWMWQKQLRFYLQKQICLIRMCDAEFHYTYEYQGNASKLVHTPLTDKCYLTLTQGMHMGLGGNPYGPAGTGKTESVKALGGLFGRQVLVFNCDEGIDVKSMGRIFIGLVKCGAWGCFDEFNRLEEAVLSAVSMQIQTIQAALKTKLPSTELLGRQVELDPNSGIFITLNPAGKGYGGRQKLPDNLKQLFRPVAMSRPDNELIAEVIMFSEGFKEAKSLGRKLVAIFNLSKELLSQQQHYDWGLRALKTVLRGCGNLLQSHKQTKGQVNAKVEARLVVQAVRVNTLSKLTFADSKRFDALVRDIFPGVDFKGVEYAELAEALRAAAQECNLMVMETQVKKALELYEQLRQRMGVVVIGPSGSGKSTIWRLLRLALGKVGQTVKHYTMNPKAMPRTQLLGKIDMDTREWSDGVLTNAARQVVREPIDIQSWIVCDGDIDPEWIESLNSVLDDNRLLTMPSGERIQFGPNVNFLFESHDLSCASPATISRMGMIFLSDEDTDVKALVKSWLQSQPEEHRRMLETFLEDHFYKALDWVLKQNEFVVETSLVGVVMNGLSHMYGVKVKQEFACALIRGLGANLSSTAKASFAKEVFHWTHEIPPDQKKPLDTYYDSDRGRLASYQLEVPDSLRVSDLSLSSGSLPVIQTPDIKRGLDMFLPWLHPDHKKPFLLVGPEGCGKELLLRHCFEQLRSTQVAVVHCSAQTSPMHVLQKLQQSCMVISSNTGRVYRPKDCERLVLYLKDLNLPKPDKWGTSQLIAFLQQVLTYNGFYDSNLEWVGLEGVQIVASMSAGTGMGRHQLTTRFTSIVGVCSIGYADKDQLQAIYSAYLQPVLSASLKSHPVWGAVKNVHSLAGSMVAVYEQVRSKFTVDDHSHYLFTPRDLTNWILGLLRYNLDSGSGDSSTQHLLEIWAYEARRLFRDRLVGKQGLDKFDSILASQLRADWSVTLDRLDNKYYVTWGSSLTASAAPASDTGNDGKVAAMASSGGSLPPQGKMLGKLDQKDFKEVITKGMKTYARENRELDILLFKEVFDNVAQVDRVLTKPGGSLLMAGRSGVGRRTAASLVSHMHNIQVFTPKVSRGYGLKQFKTDLKTVMQLSGIEGEQAVLILEDHQVDASYLELINSLMSAGEVPGLYTPEELEPLLGPLRDQASQDGFRGTLVAYFASRVRRNLHIVLIMDSLSNDFTANCESNPAFYKNCAFQWMQGWSKESMAQIPDMLLADESLRSDESKQGKDGKSSAEELVKNFLQIHESCSEKDAAPRRYMTFLKTYKQVHNEKKDGVVKRQQHLQAGVSKLTDAKALVDDLKQKAGEQSRQLADKQAEADAALREITASMQRASESKSEMETLKQKQGEESVKLEKRKKAIEIELSEIEPLVKEAKDAVGDIKPESLSEIRSLRMPPDVIRDILEAVQRLMGIFDTSWVSMKSFLAKRGVKDEICSFDARKITPDIRASVEELLEKNANSFDPKIAKRASVAAAPLAAWVVANVKFSVVLEKIEPLENEQAQLEKNLGKSQQRLVKLGNALDKVDREVAEMRKRFELRTQEATQLKMELEKAQETIQAAETLVSKLDGEFKRWSGQVHELTAELEQLPRRAQVAAGFITYLSSAPEDVRKATMSQWCEAAGLHGFDFRRFMSTESEQLVWKAEGLPSDDLSMENALVILKSTLRPFLVDPSSRATEWLKTHLKDQRLEVINQQDSNFSTALELAVRFGKTLLIQEMDGIEPVLYPILRGDFISQGPRFVVQIGEKVIDYNEDFKLFMTTRNPNLELPPDGFAIISEVNFTTTRAGLTGQLLGITIQHEKPQLEVQKTELLRKEEELKVQLAELEESLLETLASAEGNILENKELLESLNKTKASSMTIAESLQDAHRIQTTLDQERDAFLPLAESGSTLFFVISDLAKLNNMYRFSLSAFLRLFQRSLEAKQESSTTEQRIKALKSSLQSLVYEYVCRSLFKSDRLMFAIHLVHGMHPQMFEAKEWEYFNGLLVSESVFKRQESMKNLRDTLPSWIDSDRAAAVGSFKNTFPNLYKTLQLESADLWMPFQRSSQCEQDIPSSVAKKINLFQQVLVVQALRPDRLQSAMSLFASKALGMKELSPPALNLKRLVKETVPGEPILIVISPGADPSQELQDTAADVVGVDKYHQVAMGQGQADIALQLLHDCGRNGEWLCLKNLHLVTAWLPTLEKELNSLEPHENFRLWLTAESHPKFPTILLQSSLKVTYEAPPGIKKNLQRTYDSWSPEFISRGKSSIRAQALFVLAWFHAIVQERRNYIPQGWTKFYEFAFGDLRAGADIIDRLCTSAGSGNVRWKFVHGLFENAIYGGRVDNTFDAEVLRSYLLQYFEQAVFPGQSGSRSARPKKVIPNVTLPTSCHHRDYVEIINSLPDDDKPSFFGLPANIERSSQRIISSQVISQLKVLMRSDLEAHKFDKEKWSTELSPILNLWKKLNQGSQLIQMKITAPAETGDESPVTSFVQLERYNAVRLVQIVHASLSSLSKVIRGTALLDAEVQALAGSLLKQEVPLSWSSRLEGPEDPIHWLRALVAKTLALGSWVERCNSSSLLNDVLDLSELFHPDTFLNALRQQTARAMKTSIDGLKLAVSWKESQIRGTKFTVKLGGLQLEGCTFDGNTLTENQRDSPSVSAIPTAAVAWVPKDTADPYPASECISVPIYYNADRDRTVTCFNMPCSGNQARWTQCGAALFLKSQ